jgi:ATP-dependent RNA helicase SUPV3L1/SUV3
MIPGSTHTSCTIEMVSTIKEYDVAVIDEIQMIGDRERGHAWTKSLLGLRAREIHVCGGLEASQVVESLCKSTNDEFTLVKYDRMSTLE